MFSKLMNFYKNPLLLSMVLFVVMLAFRAEVKPLNIGLIFLGSLLGTFFLDLDYIVYTYFLEPKADFSRTLAGFIKHKDFSNAVSFVFNHKDDLKDKTLHSFLFQVVLGALLIFIAASDSSVFAKAVIFSAFLNSIYRMYEYNLQGKIYEWFWELKEKPNKNALMAYSTVLMVVLVYCLTLF